MIGVAPAGGKLRVERPVRGDPITNFDRCLAIGRSLVEFLQNAPDIGVEAEVLRDEIGVSAVEE